MTCKLTPAEIADYHARFISCSSGFAEPDGVLGALVIPPHLERLANPPSVAIDHDWDGNEGREGRRDLTEDEE